MGAGRWISERLVGLRLGFRAGYRSLRARQAMVTRLRLKLLTLPAPAVLLVPQDLRTADPVRAGWMARRGVSAGGSEVS